MDGRSVGATTISRCNKTTLEVLAADALYQAIELHWFEDPR